MHLSRIRARGLYDGALDLDLRLQPVTCILGPNESGKSTALSLSDYAVGAASLTEAGDVEALYQLGGEHLILRRSHDGRGQTAYVNGSKTGVRKVADQVRGILGPAHTFSLSAWLGLSANKQRDWLDKHVIGAAQLDGKTLSSALTLAEESHVELALEEHFADSDVPEEERPTTLQRLAGWTGAAELVAALIESTHEDALEAQRSKQRAKKALEAMDSVTDDLPGGTVSHWRRERAKLDEEIGELRTALGGAEQAAQSMQELERHLRRVDNELQREHSVLEAADGNRKRMVAQRRQQEQDLQELTDNLDAIDRRLADLERRESIVVEHQRKHQREIDSALQAFSALRGRQRGLAEVRPLLERAWTFCRTTWEEARGTAHGDDADQLMRDIQAVLESTSDDALAALQKEKERASKARKRCDALLETIGARQHTCASAKPHQRDRAARLRAQLETDVVAEYDARLTERHERVKALEAERLDYQNRMAELPSGGSEVQDDMLEALQAQRKDVDAKIDRLTDYEGKQAQIADLRETQQVEAARRAALVARENALQRLYNRMLEAAMEPLTGPMERIVRATLGYGVAVSFEPFTLGVVKHDTLIVPLDDCSTSVQAVLGAALCAAVGINMGGWRLVAVDDLEHIERPRRDLLVQALCAEVDQGKVDNVLLACVDHGWTPPECAHTIRLTRSTE